MAIIILFMSKIVNVSSFGIVPCECDSGFKSVLQYNFIYHNASTKSVRNSILLIALYEYWCSHLQGGATPLHEASRSDNRMKICVVLLKYNANPNAKDEVSKYVSFSFEIYYHVALFKVLV